ncbi:hypothetical protein BMETH_2522_0 [methanotrophic bacterial endosymbiont of Bathymodiolus sp.]|nr:hypothetical protein BMETH_2522_0 [methanotrophic bacterial endosymbiont of Bathymodiolus sp.]
MISQVTLIWQLVWEECLASAFLRTLIILISLNPYVNFGVAGIFHYRPGLGIMFIFH